jgi:hypothetical protein
MLNTDSKGIEGHVCKVGEDILNTCRCIERLKCINVRLRNNQARNMLVY